MSKHAESKKYGQSLEDIGILEDAERLWVKALNVGVGVKTKNNNKEQYKLDDYSERQKENWKNSKNIIIYESREQLVKFIQNTKAGGAIGKKMYLGVVPKSLSDKVFKETGIDISKRNVALAADEIRKIFKDHGNEKQENLRGQRAIIDADIADIVAIIEKPDAIRLSNTKYNGRPALEFEKTINGKTTVIAYD